jgi:hypothetical protein
MENMKMFKRICLGVMLGNIGVLIPVVIAILMGDVIPQWFAIPIAIGAVGSGITVWEKLRPS